MVKVQNEVRETVHAKLGAPLVKEKKVAKSKDKTTEVVVVEKINSKKK